MKLLTFLLAPALLTAASVNVVNPGFELAAPSTPLSSALNSYDTVTQPYGWTVTVGNLEFVQNAYCCGWVVNEGAYAVDLNGVGGDNTVLTQSISGFTPGVDYILTFGFSANPFFCTPGSPCTMTASIGAASANYSIGQSSMSWSDQSIAFTAASSTLSLTFTNTTGLGGNGGPAIDDIRINEAAPEPASMLLGGAGLALLLYRRRKLVE